MTGEEVRWGLENLNIDEERLKELGAAGLMQPLKVSCADHEGGGAVKFQQWDGKQWKVISDWITTDQHAGAADDRGLGGAVRQGEEHHAARLLEGRSKARRSDGSGRDLAPSDCMLRRRRNTAATRRTSRSTTSRSSTTTSSWC